MISSFKYKITLLLFKTFSKDLNNLANYIPMVPNRSYQYYFLFV